MENIMDATKVNRSLFAQRIVDVHNDEFGFAQDGMMYTYATDSKSNAKGIAWLRMQSTGETGKNRRKFFLYFGNETEYSAYVDKHNDIYDLDGNYIASLVRSKFIVLVVVFTTLLIVLTGLAVWLGGSFIMDTTTPFTEDNTITLDEPTDSEDDWNSDKEFNIFEEEEGDDDTIIDRIRDIITGDNDNDEDTTVTTENNDSTGESTTYKDPDTIFEEDDEVKKIYPGYQDDYHFRILNSTDMSLYYKLVITEVNNSSIPIRYKLLLDGEYVIGDKDTWVTIEELNTKQVRIKQGDKADYTIMWMWDPDTDDEYDTQLGVEGTATYDLNVKVIYEEAY